MATTAAIAATSDAIRALLRRAAAEPFPMLSVDLYLADDLRKPPPADGRLIVSVYLHRVGVSSARRQFPARTDANGRRLLPPIPLDLHYLVTAWAQSPTMQQSLLGWAVRVLEDSPVLPPSLLNDGAWDEIRPDETVELVWSPLTGEEEADVWQVAQGNRQPSASYVARMVALESRVTLTQHADVQTRAFDMALAEGVP